jgi:phosphatidylinositol alpha-1,6-mannosyltransferase
MAPLAWVLARLLGARYWLQAHGVDIWEPQSRLQRACIEAADLVTAVSRITRRRLLGWTDLPPDHVRVLPNTVRDFFAPGPPAPSLAGRLGLSRDCTGPFILTVGRLASTERSKGHERIFTAIADLRLRIRGLVYLIAGDGDDRPRLEECAREQGLGPECVRFLGWVSDEDLPDLYRLADLFVMPSTAEGFGIVFLEAAACGLRVLGGAGDGSIDTIQDARIGETVDPNDRAGLVDAIAHGLAAGRVNPAVIAAYRRPRFVATAHVLLAELMEHRAGGSAA